MSVPTEQTVPGAADVPQSQILAQLLCIVVFAALTAAGARFEIEHHPVPFTLQTLMVLLSGAFLGPRNGAVSQVLYLAAGVIGAPVFAGGAFGIARIFGPSGGYLLAFPIAAALVGWLTGLRKERLWTAFAMAVGLVVIFVLGTVHLFAFTMHDLGAAITSGFLLFTWWDLLKLGAATMIYAEIGKRWPRLPPR